MTVFAHWRSGAAGIERSLRVHALVARAGGGVTDGRLLPQGWRRVGGRIATERVGGAVAVSLVFPGMRGSA